MLASIGTRHTAPWPGQPSSKQSSKGPVYLTQQDSVPFQPPSWLATKERPTAKHSKSTVNGRRRLSVYLLRRPSWRPAPSSRSSLRMTLGLDLDKLVHSSLFSAPFHSKNRLPILSKAKTTSLAKSLRRLRATPRGAQTGSTIHFLADAF